MTTAPRILAVIPARGGSKGLPGKNLRNFSGKPLIAWSIASARAESRITDVVVSTDDEEIRRVAQEYGARAPFLRPAELAADDSNVNDAIVHCLDWLAANEGAQFDYVILLQPTQPLRPPGFLHQALDAFFASADPARTTLVSVTRADAKAALLMRADTNGFVHFALEKNPVNRQTVGQYWLPAGLVYIAPTDLYKASRSFYAERTLPFEIDADIAADIDTAADFERALELLEQLRARGRMP